MSLKHSRRIAALAPSDIREMTRVCERMGGINLGQGLGDLPTPSPVLEGAIGALQNQQNRYARSDGIPELRVAIADKLRRHNGIEADPESEIVVTAGTTGAFAATLTALLDPGDGVLLFEPFYGYHQNTILLAGLDAQFVTLDAPGFRLTGDALRAAIRPNTRAIVACTPSNPSGKIFTPEEIRIVEQVAEEFDLLVITDEIYEYITYDQHRHISPASTGDLWKRTVSIMGFSKTFSITGWRLGYAVAPEPLARAINLVADLLYVCAPTPLQYGALAGLQFAGDDIAALKAEYQRKRDLFCEGLAWAGLTPLIPQGAYYVLADVNRFGYPTAKDAAFALLEQTGVAGVPGSAFYRGAQGETLIRFCFAKEDEVLLEAAERLLDFRPAKIQARVVGSAG